jgi:hypothetical protein
MASVTELVLKRVDHVMSRGSVPVLAQRDSPSIENFFVPGNTRAAGASRVAGRRSRAPSFKFSLTAMSYRTVSPAGDR